MNDWINVINSALFHSVRTPFFALIVLFAVILALTIAFAVHEIRHDIS